MERPRKDGDKPVRKRPPATTPQARENQLIAMSYDFAEEQFRSGRATSQLATHFLKLGTERESLERAKLEAENKLLHARVEQLASNARVEELLENALDAFRSYRGDSFEDEYDER